MSRIANKMSHIAKATGFACLAVPAGLAHAQTPVEAPRPAAEQADAPAIDQAMVGDIVVTARRINERLQNVPVSITVIDAQKLSERNVRNAFDLPAVAPGLSAQASGSGTTVQFSLRGQGQTLGQSAPGVVPYFAEVPEFSTQFYDLASVQVLKGPQGTLFGRNTTGGAILFSPARPDNDLTGFVTGRLGTHDRHDLEFAAGGAIVPDKIMVRVAGQILRRDGYVHELTSGKRANDEHKTSFRASLILVPFEGLENYTIYERTRIDEHGAAQIFSGFRASHPLAAQFATLLANQQALGIRTLATSQPLFNKFKSNGVINTTTLDITENLSLKNIFSFREFDVSRGFDLDGTTLKVLDVVNPFKGYTKNRTEEVQFRGNFDRARFVAGYYDETLNDPYKLASQTVQYLAGLGFLPAGGFNEGDQKTKAGFFEATFDVSDAFSLTGGIRRTKDSRSSKAQTSLLVPGFPAGPILKASGSFKATTWNASALYKIDPNVSVYAAVRRGFRAGGFNPAASTPDLLSYDPETVTDYEVGIKSFFMTEGGWKIRTNVDLFYDDYKNIQRLVLLPTVPAATYTTNAARGNVKGLDLELVVAPNPMFETSFQYAYLDTNYKDYTDFVVTPTGLVSADLSDSRFPNAPRHQFTLTPRLNVPLSNNLGTVTALAAVYYQTGVAFDPANRINGVLQTGTTVKGYTKLDLRIDWRDIAGSGFSVAAYARNVTNKKYIVGNANQLANFGTLLYTYGEPRLLGMEATFKF
ncbi:MAG: hypothetical protein JWR77_1560 [Rhizorhabdus sp.]|nr:hypothetical protein [Rhizorhabdus sp.]